MKKCTLKIELLSDLCVSDGGAYNSLVDVDICYDRYGLPFIPAKRIRGCLRECAAELNDWGDLIKEKELFGDGGCPEKGAKLRIGNAYIEDYLDKRQILNKHGDHVIAHPQNVLSLFSYLRSQTSINYDTGVAYNKSLRTMRVANKGLVFNSDIEVAEDYYNDLEKCCKILRHMGVARTRGLGEVKVTIVPKDGDDECAVERCTPEEGATKLRYEIELLEPVIMKSVNGGESNTQDYIEGAKILGIIAGNLSENFFDFMNKGRLRCSNAYVSKSGKRYTETPGYIYRIKNEEGKIVNKLYETEGLKEETEDKQLNQAKHSYVRFTEDGTQSRIEFTDVLTQERYHHRRPDDKSKGRAMKNDDGTTGFYQMDSIAEGQTFQGEITGSEEQIEKVYEIFTNNNSFHIGYSRSSEYGKVLIKVLNTTKPDEIDKTETKDVVVVLAAPTIIYSSHAMATTDKKDLVDEVRAALGIDDGNEPTNINYYLRYCTIGGYNVTWNERKPSQDVFDKGTALHMSFSEPVEVPNNETIYIGERTAEGYGETFIMPLEADKPEEKYIMEELMSKDESSNKEIKIKIEKEFEKELCKPILESYIREAALKSIIAVDKSYAPTIGNMMLMSKTAESIEDMEKAVKDRYEKVSDVKKKKKKIADTILVKAKEAKKLADCFSKDYGIEGLELDENELQMLFLKEYLTQAKYKLRKGD